MDEDTHKGIEEIKERLTKVETTVTLTREEFRRDMSEHKQTFAAHEKVDDSRFDRVTDKIDNTRIFIAKLVGALTVASILAPILFKALGWI